MVSETYDTARRDDMETRLSRQIAHRRQRAARLTGKIQERLETAFYDNEAEVEKDVDRFEIAIKKGWTMVYGQTTSGAHGWMIQEADDHEGRYVLESGAYPEDVNWLVFVNGWVHRAGGRWLRSEEVVERVESLVQSRRDIYEEINDTVNSVVEETDGLSWWGDRNKDSAFVVAKATGYVGTAAEALAHYQGFSEAGDVVLERQADDRGRVTLGSEYANERLRVSFSLQSESSGE